MKRCLMCNKNLGNVHGRTKRCKKCNALHKKEYLRQYMNKYNLRKKWDRVTSRSRQDNDLLGENYMTGLGTFRLIEYREGNIVKEYEDIKKLKKMAGLK